MVCWSAKLRVVVRIDWRGSKCSGKMHRHGYSLLVPRRGVHLGRRVLGESTAIIQFTKKQGKGFNIRLEAGICCAWYARDLGLIAIVHGQTWAVGVCKVALGN